MSMRRPRVLLSNDDGVTAPGLVSLAHGLRVADFCDFWMCGPAGERSAQSHSISLRKELHAFPIPVEGAQEAYAVDGTPADSVMMALYSPLLCTRDFDLVVSGINRGDNCGYHVIYSGTVGAAREAALKGLPALAVSLDGYQARAPQHYAEATRVTVALMRALFSPARAAEEAGAGKRSNGAVLDASAASTPCTRRTNTSLAIELSGTSFAAEDSAMLFPNLASLQGYVLNVNVPWGDPVPAQGFYLARQGFHCHLPRFEEVAPGPDVAANYPGFDLGNSNVRSFRNRIGKMQLDNTKGSDSWAVSQGYVAVTPLTLLSDVPTSAEAHQDRAEAELVRDLRAVLRVAGAEAALAFSEAGAVDDGLQDANAARAVPLSNWQ
ncbi:survival protein SurE [Helicosporidium sp. ATCC 50920]|nr:survival protein SurE [Helicosporidium sp. ATCC 50920]|eukprot:KDD73633.1 survival protein SurE [Helicosporidium sp. ATCC 50920]